MRIGIRRIRSAGRDSGSIEITLPPELTALEGVRCAIVVRDGARPEIVLQPELTPAALVFARIWTSLRTLFTGVGDIGDFPTAEIEAVLMPPRAQPSPGSARPLLVYSYALQLGQALIANWPALLPDFEVRLASNGVTPTLYTPFAGVVAPLATVAGRRLGLQSSMAALLGRIIVMLAWPGEGHLAIVSEAVLDHMEDDTDRQFEMQVARRLWLESCSPDAPPLNLLTAGAGERPAIQALQRIVSQLRDWQERPDLRQAASVSWQQSAPGWVVSSSGAPYRRPNRIETNSYSEGD